jgi:hypothetical protein
MELNIAGLEEFAPAAAVTVLLTQSGDVEVVTDEDPILALGLLHLGSTILAAGYFDELGADEEDGDDDE